MKLNHAIIIGSALIVPAIVYISLSDKNLSDGNIRPSAEHERPIVHGLAVKDSDVNLRESLDSLRKEVASLRADVLVLQANRHEQQLKLEAASLNAVTTQVKPKLAREQVLAQNKERLRKQGELLETGFRQQTTDPRWSEQAKTLVQEALASDKIAAKDIIDIECRVSMCRVELANDNVDEPKLSDFPMKISEEMPNIMASQAQESDGSTTTILYLSKDNLASPNSGG